MAAETEGGKKYRFFRVDAAERLASTPTVHRPNSTKNSPVTSGAVVKENLQKKTKKNRLTELEMREYTKAQCQHD